MRSMALGRTDKHKSAFYRVILAIYGLSVLTGASLSATSAPQLAQNHADRKSKGV